ncbi:MAG TPA: hypothetical protein ENK91_07270 [Bacteroidetes bacterium]|nr:hypothetical protein [Bacteroidota bacterium]
MEKNKRNFANLVLISLYILIISLSKILPHPENFTPILGLAIFGGAMYIKRKVFFIVTIAALFLSDFIFNNYVHPEYFPDNNGIIFFSNYMIWVYFSIFAIIFLASKVLKHFNYLKLFFVILGSSILFYLVTNFGSWLASPELYTRDFSGIISSYIAGIPFFRSTLISNIITGFVIFGIYDLVTTYVYKGKFSLK